jgi:hypothetical protein
VFKEFRGGVAGLNIWRCKSKRRDLGKQEYSTILSLTSALDGYGWSSSSFGPLNPRKETLCQFYGRLGGLLSQCGRVRKISPPPAPSRLLLIAIPATLSRPTSGRVEAYNRLIGKRYTETKGENNVSYISGRHTCRNLTVTYCECVCVWVLSGDLCIYEGIHKYKSDTFRRHQLSL